MDSKIHDDPGNAHQKYLAIFVWHCRAILDGGILQRAPSELTAEAVSVIESGGSSEDIGPHLSFASYPERSSQKAAALNVEKRALHIINR